MKGNIQRFFRENIDGNIRLEEDIDLINLPLLLLERYNFFKTRLFDFDVMLLELLDNSLSSIQMAKNKDFVEELFNVKVIFVLKNISQFKRKKLLESGLPFIITSGQMFLPFLGLKLDKSLKVSKETIDKFTPMTQLVFLMFLYDRYKEINATELSKVLRISQVHAIRALRDLHSLDLLNVSIGGKTGRSKYYSRIKDPEFYQIGKVFLINPIMKKLYIDNTRFLDGYFYSGLDGLSRISMLNSSNNQTVAISKENARKINASFCKNHDEIIEKNLVEVEIWKYDPQIISKEKVVDILSLKMSLEGLMDDRVDIELDKVLEKKEWYTA